MPHPSVASQFLILPAGPADAEALARVHVASWRETYRGLLSDAYLARMSEAAHTRRFAAQLLRPGPHDVTLAVAHPSGLVGYAQGGPSRRRAEGEAEVSTLYLLQAVQGLGLGRRLLAETVRALAGFGARSLVISVLRDNLPARAFYEHLRGEAEPARQERSPDGQLLYEVAYRWADIRTLTG